MIRISQLKLPIDHDEEALKRKVAGVLRLKEAPSEVEIKRQSVDARDKQSLCFVYTVDVSLPGEKKIVARCKNRNVSLVEEAPYQFPAPGELPLPERPVVVGSGPAGLFCAWYLARAGFAPLVLERGERVEEREASVKAFWEGGRLNPNSNVQFGEGGAGTFSDGKLNTQVKDPSGRNGEVLRRFLAAGAPREILYVQKPHLGTDVLSGIVRTLREEILEMGGEVRFGTKLSSFLLKEGRLCGVVTEGTDPRREDFGKKEEVSTQLCVLAIGHSARDTFEMLKSQGISMQPKAFAVGVRAEHPQETIDLGLYGRRIPSLGAAAYKLTHTCQNGRGVYSFCMCPGGYVVNASSEEGGLCVNGMSYSGRAGENANSAIIVTVTPEDFPEEGPLGGILLQRKLERAAYQAGQGRIPVQRLTDFCQHQSTTSLGHVKPQTKGGYVLGDVRSLLPEVVADCIQEGMEAFGKKLPGFDDPDTLLLGVESRTSSPVRILRGDNLQSSLLGLYPCGEGAGYAGGITSAAMDGLKVAEAIVKQYHPAFEGRKKNGKEKGEAL